MNTKTILITGGAGYIGSVLAMQLQQRGYHIVIIDDLSTGLEANIPPNCTFYAMDINSSELATVFAKHMPEYIVHMAASKSVNESMKHPEKFRKINVDGSKHVIDVAMSCGIQNLLFTSTAGVYGDVTTATAQQESDIPHPSSPYAETKLEIETYILEKNTQGFHGTIVRFANVYGSGGKADQKGAINIFIEKIIAREPIAIHGDGNQTRDFVHIDDLISACIAILQSPVIETRESPVYNISTGKDISINMLISLIARLSHRDPITQFQPSTFIGQKSSLLSTQKAKNIMGWEAKISLEKGITDMVDQYTKNL